MGNKHILVVDDDIDLNEGMADFLRDEGYVVENTTDPFKAGELAKSQVFDMALLDFKMAGLTGMDVLKSIKESSPQTKIYFVTGRPGIEKILQEENLTPYVSGLISKPFNPIYLLEKIKEALPT